MNVCNRCGAVCLDDPCIDCRYRRGGRVSDREEQEMDLVDQMVRHSKKHFRDGFTPDQIQQVSCSER
jgi:hypothetical protein